MGTESTRTRFQITQALEYASRMGQTEAIQLLLEHGVDIKECQGRALSWAVDQGNINVVQLLLEEGVDVNRGGQKPISQAAIEGYKDIVQLLIEYGAGINVNNGQPLLHMAMRGHPDTVQCLFDHGADISMGRVLQTIDVLEKCDPAVQKLLVEHIDLKTGFARRSLLLAAEYDYMDVVDLLLAPEVSEQEMDKMICYVTQYGPVDLVRAVLKKSVSVDAMSNALFLAVRRRSVELTQLLLEHGAEPDRGSDLSDSPLICAAGTGQMGIFKRLLEYGAGHEATIHAVATQPSGLLKKHHQETWLQ